MLTRDEVPKIELPEYAKFKIHDISDKIKEKLFKMKENGIESVDDEISFLIKNTVETNSLAKGLSPDKTKELGQQVKSYYDSLIIYTLCND